MQDRGITLDTINSQIRHFKEGFPYADITMPATPGKGMLILSDGEERHFQDVYLNNAPDFSIVRFIPASGAASRMFKELFTAWEHLQGLNREQELALVEEMPEIRKFLKTLPKYPFYEDLEIKENPSPSEVFAAILGEEGLNYGQMPKGLLKFHKYDETDRRSAFEEHLLEAIKYCPNRNRLVQVHMTVSPEHFDAFREEADALIPKLEKKTGISVEIDFSFQQTETDTVAVDMGNEPFRLEDGSLLFRPAGHGALINNLDKLNADIVFISNIDNVCPDRLKNIRARYKQILGGVLLEASSKIFYYLQQLTNEEKPERTRLDSMVDYLYNRLGQAIPDGLGTWDVPELRRWLISAMNRPIRVCGMVKNEGEPGGGPYYVRSENGEITLQIVEKSQIDMDSPVKALMVGESTHFNPVDLVCSLKDFRGEKFTMARYVDPRTGFISEKSQGGKSLKALELPGLWNGAMAGWLTLFVEVPSATFSPVKTVFDLLRTEHRT